MAKLPTDDLGHPIPAMFPKTYQTISFGAGALETNAFNTKTRAVALLAKTNDCRIALGDAAVSADANSPFIPKDIWLVFSVMDEGVQATHLSAVQDTAAGTLHILELT